VAAIDKAMKKASKSKKTDKAQAQPEAATKAKKS
jgi:hypothetical protein